MLRNYLLVSFRNIRRHFTYSFVNIFGLTIGLACTMVIGMWVYQEHSYDRHFDDADNIYRVGVNFYNVGDLAIGPEILKEKLLEFPQIDRTTNLKTLGKLTIVLGDKEVDVPLFFDSDEDFFQVFSYEFLQGDPATALSEPASIVLSQDLAMKLFGTDNVLNRTIELKDDDKPKRITGVVVTDKKSHIPAQAWLSNMGREKVNSWLSAGSYSYVLLNTDTPAQSLDEALENLLHTDIHKMITDGSYQEFKESGLYKFLPIAIKDIHLRSPLRFETSNTGNETTTNVFGGVALLILLLASINFVNISTARATMRAKEVGIRKSLGTSKGQLILQFVFESVLICLIAVGLGMVMGDVFLQLFEKFTGLELLSSLFANPVQIILAIVGAVFLGVAAGIYPAFYIAKFQPVKVLKGSIGVKEKGFVRSGLVLFQFVISISLLMVSMFVFKQLQFIENKDLGFETESILIVDRLEALENKKEIFKQELQNISQIEAVSLNTRAPASSASSVESVRKNGEENDYFMQRFVGDDDLLEAYGFRLLEGRNFSNDLASDSASIILNQTAAQELGFDDPVGQTLNGGELRIIGVVSDFNFESLKSGVSPVLLRRGVDQAYTMAIKFNGSNPERMLQDIEQVWASLVPDESLSYYFLDESFEEMVAKERTLSKAVLVFTALAMFISCLGLYGLSVFTAERKVKEIGIRRVLGASIVSITQLLSRNFAIPILVAFLIAIPISYLGVNEWLSNYAYRIDISPYVFALSGAIALLVGLVTVSWQSVKSALKNPVESLRAE